MDGINDGYNVAYEFTKKFYDIDPFDPYSIGQYTEALMGMAIGYYESHQIDEASEKGEEAVRILKEYFNRDPKRSNARLTIKALNNQALVLCSQNDRKSAITLLEDAVDLCDMMEIDYAKSIDYMYSIPVLNNLAKIYQDIGSIDDAIKTAKISLENLEIIFHSNLINSWVEDQYLMVLKILASAYMEKKMYDQASKMFYTYFERFDIKKSDHIQDVVEHFKQWYQCEMLRGDGEIIEAMDLRMKELITVMRQGNMTSQAMGDKLELIRS